MSGNDTLVRREGSIPMPSTFSKIIDSALLLALATAFLYCAGSAYYGGYFGVLHLDADVLDRNFHQILYKGFYISIFPVLLVFLIYLAWRFTYSYMALPAVMDWVGHSAARKRKIAKIKATLLGKRKESPRVTQAIRKTNVLAFYFILSNAFILSLVYCEIQGKEVAKAALRSIERKQESPANLISVKIDTELKQLYFLGCGARNCAGIEYATKRVYYFPQNGHSYTYGKQTPAPTAVLPKDASP